MTKVIGKISDIGLDGTYELYKKRQKELTEQADFMRQRYNKVIDDLNVGQKELFSSIDDALIANKMATERMSETHAVVIDDCGYIITNTRSGNPFAGLMDGLNGGD